ncbi:MAG: hypothetical protein ABJ327_25690 [Litoreibacter sp.]
MHIVIQASICVALASTLALPFGTAASADEVLVVDPTSGETISLSDVDVSSLSYEDRRSIGDQLAELGAAPSRGGLSREEIADVDVTDPTSGETVSLSDVDVSSLSDDDRQSIGDQLADQGVSPGRGRQGGRRN